MKKLALLVLFVASLFAEATFEQVQKMIDKQDYKQAKFALTIITQNHPESAKAFYALAQANAGLGQLQDARIALEKAEGLNPALPFATKDQINDLKKAIQPQTKLITKVEEPSNWFRNLLIILVVGFLAMFGFKKYKEKQCEKLKKKKEEQKSSNFDNYSSRSKDSTFKQRDESSDYVYYKQPTTKSYAETHQSSSINQQPNRTVEIHNHYNTNTNNNNTSDMLVAGAVGYGLGSISNNHHYDEERHTSSGTYNFSRNEEPEQRISNSWNDNESTKVSKSWDKLSSSISSSWDEPSSSSKSSSWDSSSSSSDSSSSWSD